MKIGFVGDSWTYGFGVEKSNTFPFLLKQKLNTDIEILSQCGADNNMIKQNSISLIEMSLIDFLIIGWSGITRIQDTSVEEYVQFSLSMVFDENTENRKLFFKNHNLNFLQEKWDNELKVIENLCFEKNIKLIHFSVFGDKPINKYPNFLDISFLEYLAIDQTGSKFNYDIPIFEYGFFGDTIAEEFCDRNLDSNWRLACLEREELRLDQPKKNFLNCGHPTKNGHKLWCNFLCEKISKY